MLAYDYQHRIVSASRGQLLVITYELLLTTIDEAVDCIKKEDKPLTIQKINQAKKFLRELTDSLDMSYSISNQLMSLYIYINKLFVTSYIKSSEEPLLEAKKLLMILLEGWKEAVNNESEDKPLMENTQKVYAGLTYGKGTLNEVVYEGEKVRGIQV